MNKKLSFSFKGGRNYVRGTDMFNAVLAVVGDSVKDIDFNIYRLTGNNIILTDDSSKPAPVFRFTYNDSEVRKSLFGIETEEKVTCRYNYDENDIIKACELDLEKGEIQLSSDTGFSFIENLVAMNKYLLNNLFKPQSGMWLFVRLQLVEVPKNFETMSLKFEGGLGMSLTKTSIRVSDKHMGYIYFSWRER